MRHTPGFVLVFLLASAAVAFGQAAGTATSGSIWGTVKDTTGAVLPGVTATVEGPSLLRSQIAVTNGQGVYRFPSLPPGEFKVTFTIPQFTTVVREGIRLTLGFTATVDAEMSVSTVEETVRVVGGSPVVDTVNTRVQASFTKDVLASVPSGRDLWSILAEAPAVQMSRIDVGGSAAGTQSGYRAYGTSGQVAPVVEGILALESSGGTGWYFDYGSFEEVSIGGASQGAEMATPGVRTVFISKSGGNELHGSFYMDYENSRLQGHNIDSDQLAMGVRPGSNRMAKYMDVNADAGGAIRKDTLWWYASVRRQEVQVNQPNFTFRPLATILPNWTGKLTYQLGKNNRFVGYLQAGRKRQPDRLNTLLLGSTGIYKDENATWPQVNPAWMGKVEWNRTIGSSMFLEARVGRWGVHTTSSRKTDAPHYEDLVTRAVAGGTYDWETWHYRPQASGALSIFKATGRGSHDLKLGFEMNKDQTREFWHNAYPDNVVHVLRSGVPTEMYQMAAPLDGTNQLYWTGAYLRDTWALKRLTLNAGLRWDRYRSAYPDQSRPASRFFDVMVVPANDNIITWDVVGPRLGLAWDLTGKARDVLKSSFGRYYHNPSKTVTSAVNPNNYPQWKRYTWLDGNGDLLYQPGEETKLLGTRGGIASSGFDPNLKDEYTDEFTLSFEREIGNQFGLRTGMVYKRSTRLFKTVNSENPPEAFNIPVSVVDPGPDGLSGTSDDAVLQLLNLDPASIGRTFTTIINVADYSNTYWTWEVAANRRFSNKWSMNASFAVTWRNDFEGIPYTPNEPPQSKLLPMRFIKIMGTYEPGWGMRITPLVRFQSGEPFARRVSAKLNYGTVSVVAEETGARRRDSVQLFDVRLERKFQFLKAHSFSVFVDVFNILNDNAAVDITIVTGSSFLLPSTIVPPRVVRVGTKFSW